MELKNLCVSTTPEQMWQELQKEKKLRNEGFDLNNLPESNVYPDEPQTFTAFSDENTSVYEKVLLQGVYLLEDELLQAMHHPRAKIILTKHINLCRRLGYGNGFYKRVQRALCTSAWGREFLYDYLKTHHYWSLDSTTILILQEQQQNFFTEKPEKLKDILLWHCTNGWLLFEDTKLKLVGFSFAPEILMTYLKNTKGYLSSAVLSKICKQPYKNDFLVEYAKFGYDIDYDVQKKISKLACAKEFFSIYATTDADVDMEIYHSLCD